MPDEIFIRHLLAFDWAMLALSFTTVLALILMH
jgi:hypothetical protein